MLQRLSSCALLFTVILVTSVGVRADTTGTIVGTVMDQNGGVVIGATVTAVHVATNLSRTTQTDVRGAYRFAALPIGQYQVTVEAATFAKFIRELKLEISEEQRMDVELVVAVAGEVSDIFDYDDGIDTESSTVSTVIDNKKITELPLNGRNFLQLGALIPGVAVAPGGGGAEGGTFVGAFSVGGQRDRGANYQLDGADNNQVINNNAAAFVNVDAIEEFTILTSTFSAEYGRNSGAVVNVATRSGSNQFRGSVFEFFRHDALDANNFFENAGGAPDSKFVLNQFGGVFGGPIKRDRIFFFASYEGLRSDVGNTIFTNVPTLEERAAVETGILHGHPIAIDPVAANFIALYPLPNASSEFGNYLSNLPIDNRNDNAMGRVDYNRDDRNTFNFRYLFNDTHAFAPVLSTSGTASGSSQVPGYGLDTISSAHNFTASWTHLITSTAINVGKLVAARQYDLIRGEDHTNPAIYGLPTNVVNPDNVALPQFIVSGMSGLGNSNIFPFGDSLNTFQVIDSLTWSRGSHTLKAGVDMRYVQVNGFGDYGFAGSISFDGSVSGISPLYDFLQGTASPQTTFITRGSTSPPIRQQNYYAFIQDDWKARLNLTLNLGLRYELNTVPTASGRLSNFTPERGFWTDDEDGLFEGDHNNWAPRLGFAWTPWKDGKTVVRGGAGMFYDAVFANVVFNLTYNPPASVQFYPLYGRLPRPGRLGRVFANLPVGPDFEGWGPALITIDPDMRTPYAIQWNLNVQRSLTQGVSMEVGYYGTRGLKLVMNRDINQAIYYPGSTYLDVFDRRPTQLGGKAYLIDGIDTGGIDLVQQQEASANSIYHSLQTRISGSIGSSFSFLSSYTWSHSIDNASDIFGFTGSAGFPQDSNNLAGERGDSPFDIRHRFTSSYTWDIPYGSGAVLGGWHVNGIVTAQSGLPYSLRLGTDGALDGNPYNEQRPNFVPGAIVPDGEGGLILNAPRESLFPAEGSYGTLGRNTYRGSKYVNFDMSVFKDLAVAEHSELQLRVEVFNIFNHPNFALPETNLLSPTFGQF